MKDSMMLITSSWNNTPTFKLIPADGNCPYNEAIFDNVNRVLALISKEKKESMHMLPKLNEWGDITPMKIGKRMNGKDYAEERKMIPTYYEYYIEEPSEIKEFLNYVAVNSDSFDFQKFLDAPKPVIEPAKSAIIS